MAGLSTLPSELIHHILTFLPLSDLLTLGLVSHAFLEHSRQDTLYQTFVQAHVPGYVVPKPSGLTWRELFKLHHPYWFIPKNKIWFSDSPHTGKLIVARYDHRLNAMEGYALVAERRQPTFQTWSYNQQTIVHSFDPRIKLDLNAPVLRLDARGYECAVGSVGHRLQKEIPLNLRDDPPHIGSGLHTQLVLARPRSADTITQATPIWPPLTMPSYARTVNESPSHFRDLSHRPSKLHELSAAHFRLRRWMEFSTRPFGGWRVGEDVTTWATLPNECYTPTPQKPWQGIFVGDYAGHGCEFLAVMQPDDPKPLPEKAEAVIRAREREGSVSSGGSWNTAPTQQDEGVEVDWEAEQTTEGGEHHDMEDSVATLHAWPEISTADEHRDHNDHNDETMYQGRIEAVKLTGDPNIPRGEYTFIAPDIGPDGLIRVAEEDLFKGARIVKSVGHIAFRGFVNDDYMTSQLILISHDRLAQYWETFGHVSFYQRVNIDDFTKI
ncbi:F-box domain-containing protein [Bimuria novae-zelandiae CBS 107.79]|uniref:F-box domain-containing protein n=1 Tax=Bimuria novae-zelandiae CBS 107.79 TaxID=1447943 RepID=A0A6A5VIE7_9PLEO|nr:F-box domain-containing protein [Bimuria novae-zelandiae CBS 107.79]